ncbi:MAG: ParA family protein [Gammaproteobacteria bacterium]
MKILSSYSIKGGVGKTATAVNLAYLAAAQGYRTVLWDLDPQGAASYYFRVKPKFKGGVEALTQGKRALADAIKATDFPNLDLIPADFSYRNLDLEFAQAKGPLKQMLRLLRPLADEYDVLFIDAAPSISLVSENIFLAANALLVPVIPTPLSIRTLDQLNKYLDKKRTPDCNVLPFFSMSDRRKKLHRQVMEELPERHPGLLQAAIPYSALVESMGIDRRPMVFSKPGTPPAAAYAELWSEVRARVGL